MTVRIYGIANCDKVRAARAWFGKHQVPVEFHDFRKDGLNEAVLRRWFSQAGWSELLNRASATWRGLPETRKKGIDNPAAALALMIEHPTLIKRPLIERGGRLEIGFKAPKS